MSCLFTDRAEYSNTNLLTFANNGNDTNLPFFFKTRTNCQLIPHRHDYLQFVYIRKGQLAHVCGSNIADLRCGDLLLMPPYIPHYFIPIAGRPFELIEFEFEAFFIDSCLTSGIAYDGVDALEWLEKYTSGHNFPLASLTGASRFETENTIDEIEREYTGRTPGFQSVIRACALKMLTLQRRAILTQNENDGTHLLYERHREVLLRSLDFIRENYTRDISVQDAAAVAIMSPSYYRHYFKLLTHKTFTEYLNGLRISHAITLIRDNPRMKIVDICYAAGFSNISHFNRTFLKIAGVTPKTFRSSTVLGTDGTPDLRDGI